MRSAKALPCTMLFIFLVLSNTPVEAQDKSPEGATSYVPSLGDMMAATQLRHSKLFYAGKLKNWPLADYELGQLSMNLKQVVRFYPAVPGRDLAGLDKAAILIDESIKAMDDGKFEKAFTQMTAECNSCHDAAGRPFIYVRRPTFPSPYSNQVFAPRKR